MKLLSLICLTAFTWAMSASADDLQALAGKWSVKKMNDQGQSIIQTIEIKNDKFIFEVLTPDDSVRIHAEGDFSLEKLGPFRAARFSHIRGGSSASNMDDVDDVYVSVYRLDDDAWTMAANFDKDRDGQKPSTDVYRRVKSSGASKPAK